MNGFFSDHLFRLSFNRTFLRLNLTTLIFRLTLTGLTFTELFNSFLKLSHRSEEVTEANASINYFVKESVLGSVLFNSVNNSSIQPHSTIVGKTFFKNREIFFDFFLIFDIKEATIVVGLKLDIPDIVKRCLGFDPFSNDVVELCQVVFLEFHGLESPPEASGKVVPGSNWKYAENYIFQIKIMV